MNNKQLSVLGLVLCTLGCAVEAGEVEHLDSKEQEILNGTVGSRSAELSRYFLQPTVWVRTTTGGICSGTALRNNLVLTARHCVTTDDRVDGPLGAQNSVAVSVNELAPTLGCNTNNCRTTTQILTTGVETEDVALLVLGGPVTINGSTTGHYSPVEAAERQGFGEA